MFRVLDFKRGKGNLFFFVYVKSNRNARAQKVTDRQHTTKHLPRASYRTHRLHITHTRTHRFAFQRALLIVRKQLLRARKLEVSNCTGNNKFQLLKK